MKRCRHCNKQIQDNAVACPFCRKSLRPAGPTPTPNAPASSAEPQPAQIIELMEALKASLAAKAKLELEERARDERAAQHQEPHSVDEGDDGEAQEPDEVNPSESPRDTSNGWIAGVLIVAALWWYQVRVTDHAPTTDDRVVSPRQGDLANRGGTPTVRKPFVQQLDDPSTSNDEANDQPVGHFGTVTLSVCSVQSGNCYTLDGEMSGTTLERVYFPKGGWVDFLSCELDDDLQGTCDDEEGRSWSFEGEG